MSIERIVKFKSYVMRGKPCKVIGFKASIPRVGMPGKVTVQYNDGTTENFLEAFFRREAEKSE